MAWSTPRTWVAGDVLTAGQLNQELRDNLTAAHALGVDGWTSWTPTLVQSGAVTKTVRYAKYTRVGRLVIASWDLGVTGPGTAANVIYVGVPVTAAYAAFQMVGSAHLVAGGINYPANACLPTTTTVAMLPCSTDQTGLLGAAVFTGALANTHTITGTIMYEAAT